MTRTIVTSASAFDSVEPIPADASSADNTGDAFSRPAVLARRQSAPDWLSDCLKRIGLLADLESDWDSYGAEPVDPASLVLAEQFIEWFAMFDLIGEPVVTASADGYVLFSWDDGERSLDVEVLPDGRLEYGYRHRDTGAEFDDVTMQLEHLAHLLTRW
jgi:hypothetical protein